PRERLRLAVTPDEVRVRGDHPTAREKARNLVRIRAPAGLSDAKAGGQHSTRKILAERQAIRVRRVEEELLRCRRHDDVRIAEVQGEVAPPLLLVAESGDQPLVARERVPEDQFAPAAVD